MSTYGPTAFEQEETPACLWWGEGTTYAVIQHDDTGRVWLDDATTPLPAASTNERYPLRCVLDRDVANRLLTDVCSVLNASDRDRTAGQAIEALIQTYRRQKGWMLEELPDYYLDDEAADVARYRLGPRLQTAGTNAEAAANAIWATMPSQTRWAFPAWDDLHFDDPGPARVGWVVDEEIHIQRIIGERCRADAVRDVDRDRVLEALLQRIDRKVYVRSILADLRAHV